MSSEEVAYCPDCQEFKDISEFGVWNKPMKNGGTKLTRQPVCKLCKGKRQKVYRNTARGRLIQNAANDRSEKKAPLYNEVKDSFQEAADEAYRMLGVTPTEVEEILEPKRGRAR